MNHAPNAETNPADEWLDALTEPLIVLMNAFVVIGVIGIVASILLLIARSPKAPPARKARR